MTEQNKTRLIKILFDPKAIAGVIISIIGIYWAFKDFMFVEFAKSIQTINYIYLLLATFFLWISVWLRAMRWRYLLRKDVKITTASLYRAELMGYFGNNVLPLRLGELMRAYLIGREWNISKSYIFGTVVLERVLDTLTLATLALLLIFYYPLEESVREFIIWNGGVILVVIMILLIILHHIKTIKGNHAVLNALKQMIEGLLSIRKSSIFSLTVLSILIWGIYYLDVYLLQCAFQFNLSFSQVLMVLVLSSLALAIPSAPGMIGTFHAAVKYTMVDLFGYTAHDSNSFAIFMHAYGYILFTCLGAYYFINNQFHTKAIRSVIPDSNKKITNIMD